MKTNCAEEDICVALEKPTLTKLFLICHSLWSPSFSRIAK